jgi:hypothetical protein
MQRKKALTIAATTAIVLGAATAAGATNMGLLGTNRRAPDIGTLTVPTVTTSATSAAPVVEASSTHKNDDAVSAVAGTPPVSAEPAGETETETESATTAPSSSSSTTVKSTAGSGHESGDDESGDGTSSTHSPGTTRPSTSTTVHLHDDDHVSGDGGSDHDDD